MGGFPLALAIGGSGVRRQGEGEIVVSAAGVGAGNGFACGQTGAGRSQIVDEVGKRGFGIIELKIGHVFRVEQRGADRDVAAQQRLHRESIEAALQFGAALETDWL